MSYEGSVEYLCANGHESGTDCYMDDLIVCRCGAPITHRHAINHTNGEDPEDPSTMPAPVEEIGFDDVWHKDHYGNRYATKDMRFKPLDHWRELVGH